jgi:metalloprotease
MQDKSEFLSRRQVMVFAALAGGVSAVSPLQAQFNIGKALSAGKKMAEAESLSDAELNNYFGQIAADMDGQNPVAGPKTPYGKRIAALSKGLQNYDGLNLDIKAYMVSEVNAFAMANGTIRVFAGLMDKFTDDEIRYVIGHEIGHVKSGHTKARMQSAMRTSALMDVAGSAGGKVGRISQGQLGKLFEKVVSAQHSQGNERQADDYAMNFMKQNKYPAMACVTALDKLTALSGGGGAGLPWLATHPSPKERAKRMRTQLGA